MAVHEHLRPGRSAPGRRRVRLEAVGGWSLIELLLASALFLVALLAATPLFVRAVGDVRAGGVRSTASALAQDALESALPPPVAGSPVARVEYYSFERRHWLAEPPAPPDRALWVRETKGLLYPLAAISDGRVAPGESTPGGDCRPADSPAICLLGVRVELSRRPGGRPVVTLERLEWTGG